VINGLSDLYHPCQILADLQTIREVKGGLSGLKIAWVGDGDNNVVNTFIVAAAKLNLNLNIACPKEYRPRKEVLEEAGNAKIHITEDPIEAVADADVVITDTFISMGKEAEREKRLSTFLPRYQVSRGLMELAKRDAYLPPLPTRTQR
jgi:ornithine carbamoyltransferase